MSAANYCAAFLTHTQSTPVSQENYNQGKINETTLLTPLGCFQYAVIINLTQSTDEQLLSWQLGQWCQGSLMCGGRKGLAHVF